jgi:8-oxo-dGTP diphosphatase
MEEYTDVVNVEGAVVRNGEYLLVERAADEEHAAGLLAFPGGKVEQPPGGDATIGTTARRELREEVGAVEYVRSRTFEAAGTPCVNVVTICEYAGGEASVREPEEVAAVHWLSPDVDLNSTGTTTLYGGGGGGPLAVARRDTRLRRRAGVPRGRWRGDRADAPRTMSPR